MIAVKFHPLILHVFLLDSRQIQFLSKLNENDCLLQLAFETTKPLLWGPKNLSDINSRKILYIQDFPGLEYFNP